VLISDATLQLTDAAFDCAPRGVLAGPGVAAYGVLAARPRPLAGDDEPLIGRNRDIDALERARKDGIAVLVTGDAGIGKSALIRAYRSAYGLNGAEFACDVSTGWLDTFTPEWHADPPLSGDALLSALRDGVEREVQEGGVLWIDDLHWADPTTLEFVEHLLLHPLPGRFMILTARSGFVPPWCASKTRVLRLEPLAPDAITAMIDSVVNGASLDRAACRRIEYLGEGVPLYLEACTRDALAQVRAGHTSLTTGSTVPAELHDVLMAQLDAAGAALPVAQFASTMGVAFSAGLLAMALDIAPAALAPMLDALIVHRIVRHIDGDRYAFRYALLREAAYQSQTREAREAAHRRIDEALTPRLTKEPAPTPCDCACAAGDDALAESA
ncbi:MAG TPA: AAA family ATPase, partial [Paraburkholderia sp.]|nr:AAA family ATPase [Paraburkholderia sp.]